MKSFRSSILLAFACICYGSSLQAQNVAQGTYKNIYDMLLNVPGLEVKTGPKGGSVTVRGVSSLTRSAQPLFVIDGSIYSGDIMQINPQDVESINVLKDAASTAVYGAQGAAGVIVIAMKKGTDRARPATVTTHNESAYTYFIEHKTKLRIFGQDDKVIVEGVIEKQEGDVLVFRKKKNELRVAVKDIKRVEMMPADE